LNHYLIRIIRGVELIFSVVFFSKKKSTFIAYDPEAMGKKKKTYFGGVQRQSFLKKVRRHEERDEVIQ